MRYFSADYIYPGKGSPIKNGIIKTDDKGKILEVIDYATNTIPPNKIEKYRGIICPGFINTHCHLELSYLKGKIKPNSQLHGFIQELMNVRENFTDEQRINAIHQAEDEMKRNGIVAVGDISNGNSTFDIKKNSKIHYHTFIEVFGSDPAIAQQAFLHAEQLYSNYFESNHVSITPHATYSVSNELSTLIHQHCIKNNSLLSIHNQETASENRLFQEGKGELFDLLKIGEKTKGNYLPSKQNALPSFLSRFSGVGKTLLVHNTFTEKEDIEWAKQFSDTVYWAFCPNANLYIENRLPNFILFENEKCTIGTDSLASNHQLSVLEELKTINNKAPEIALTTLIKWATINGADFFSIDNQFGSIEVGKTPGVNLIENIDFSTMRLTRESTIRVLI